MKCLKPYILQIHICILVRYEQSVTDIEMLQFESDVLETEDLNLNGNNTRGADVSITEGNRQRIRGIISPR